MTDFNAIGTKIIREATGAELERMAQYGEYDYTGKQASTHLFELGSILIGDAENAQQFIDPNFSPSIIVNRSDSYVASIVHAAIVLSLRGQLQALLSIEQEHRRILHSPGSGYLTPHFFGAGGSHDLSGPSNMLPNNCRFKKPGAVDEFPAAFSIRESVYLLF